MCSFLLFVYKYAVISAVCKLGSVDVFLLDFTKFCYWVIIKYCMISLQVWICSFNWDTCSPAVFPVAQNLVQKHHFKKPFLTELSFWLFLVLFLMNQKNVRIFLEIGFHYMIHISFKFIIFPNPLPHWVLELWTYVTAPSNHIFPCCIFLGSLRITVFPLC